MNRLHYSQHVSLSFLVFFSIFLLLSPIAARANGLAGSGQHSLAIRPGNAYGYAWGANQAGQIGTDTAGKNQAYPFLWSPGSEIATADITDHAWIQVASGDWHSVALRDDGMVWTWGQNGHGQLGDGTKTDRARPAQVPGLSNVIAVAAGKYHSLAVTQAGEVWAWGNNAHRQLGNNSSDAALEPVQVVIERPGDDTRPVTFPPLTGVIAVATSEVHSMALKSDGTVWAWGKNQYGQLGTGNTFDSATAQQVPGLTEVKTIVAGGYDSTPVTTGTAYTLAQRHNGTWWGWGNNAKCQLGEAAWEEQTTPMQLVNLSNLGELQVLAGGGAHGVALLADGRVSTWGDNLHGQLGDGTSNRVCTPLMVDIDEVETISAGETHTLVTQRDGTVWAWGGNQYGQLGNGTASDNPQPTPVKGICRVGELNIKTPPPTGCPLTVEQTGDGNGTVNGAGEYAASETVTLTGTPDAGSRFDGWSPLRCNDHPFTMPAHALTCTAQFSRMETVTYPLTLNTAGNGGGVAEGSGHYLAGASVTLSAEPAADSAFTGWNPHPCAISFLMPANALTCTATFELLPIVPLVVLTNGNGVVSGGGQYRVGETVTLTATPQSDQAQFAGWSPAPCAPVLTMSDQALTCTATFTSNDSPEEPDVASAALVRHYYQAILGRTPEPSGQAHWEGEVKRLQNLGVDRPEVFRVMAVQFFVSGEYLNKNTSDIQYVTALYDTFFQRSPDEAGLAYWTGQLAAYLPRDIVLYEFLFSVEFTNYMREQFGETTSRAEALAIIDFYRGLLGRLPDDGGFRYWLEQFQTAQCQGAEAINAAVEAISRLFATSPEYRNRERMNSEYLQDLYNAFLRRGADVNGFAYWLNRLDSGDLTREQARRAFIATSEFQGRVNQIIRQGCINAVTTYTQISAGGSHTCGIMNDGAVACWGRNDEGHATPPAGVFTQISAGNAHTCGVRDSGAVACWGISAFGETLPPTGVFTQVSAGNGYSCGVRNGGAVECWGQNHQGQATPPVDATFAQVSAGDDYACGVKSDGTIACWGNNEYGRATPPVGNFTQVSASLWYACGVKSDQSVACWGDENYTQDIPSDRFTQVSTGDWHTCGLKLDGAVACWGSNGYGQATAPVGTFTQISAGSYHNCGLKNDGAVACWGWNENGEATPSISGDYYVPLEILLTGSGAVTSQPAGIDCGMDCRKSYARHTIVTLTAASSDGSPFSHWSGACSGKALTCQVAMSDAQSVQAIFGSNTTSDAYLQVSAGNTHTCGVKNDNTVICWGNNGNGQATSPAETFQQVSAGYRHTCGVRNDGKVACWGRNNYGEATPPADGVFIQVSAGDTHSCGLKSDGALACWGQGIYHDTAPREGIFTDVSVGYVHTCAVREDSVLVCWGNDDYGQATVLPALLFTQVSAGYWHTCGIKKDDVIQCWGRSEEGQAKPPAGVFSQVSAGWDFTCGVRSDHSVACWGNNLDGQANRPAGAFKQVSTGGTHTCGVKSDGAVVCWGSNSFGESTPP
jgi:alpha-tubulin suppressor-like RCC1 family protein